MKSEKQKTGSGNTSPGWEKDDPCDVMIHNHFKNPECRQSFIIASLKAGDPPEKIEYLLNYFGYY